MRTRLLLALLCGGALVALFIGGARAASPPDFVADFEADATEPPPARWTVEGNSASDYRAVVDAHGAHGIHSLRLEPVPARHGEYGSLSTTVDAAPYRNHAVRLTMAVRAKAPPQRATQGGVFLRVEGRDGRVALYKTSATQSPLTEDWATVTLEGVIAPDAAHIVCGVIVMGDAQVWIDDVSLRAIAPVAPPEPPRPLSARGQANEVAFARLLGYVRFFHPSDEAARADWDELAVRGARAIESATTPTEAARRLQALFAPLAPTLRVFPSAAGGPRAPLSRALQPAGDGAARVTMWVHHGFGNGNPSDNVYRSTREFQPWSPSLPAPFADPRSPPTYDLGGGVAAVVPLALFVDERGTLPHTVSPPPPPLFTSGDDRGTRLADVALAWGVFQHFYPYFDVARVDWDAALVAALREAATDRGEAELGDTLRRLVARLGDGHGGVVGPSALGDAVLPLTWEMVDGALTVVDVAPSVGGIVRGDVVVAIDGFAASRALERVMDLSSGATPQARELRALQALAVGPAGSTARLEIAARDGAARTVDVARVKAGTYEREHERRPARLTELRPGVWYVDLTRIDSAALEAAMPSLAKARAVVFDLRGYPSQLDPAWLGHLTTQHLQSAIWQIPLVTRPDRRDIEMQPTARWDLSPLMPQIPARRAVIIDARAISYAESLAAIIEAYRLAELVGEPTAGTNGNINPFTLPGGYTITWTGMRVLRHDGRIHHGRGIAPTLPVHRTRAGIAAGRDELLDAAIAAVTR